MHYPSPCSPLLIRWLSTNNNNKNNNSHNNDSSDAARHRAFEQEHSAAEADGGAQNPSPLLEESTRERLTAGAAAATQQLEQRLKMVVNELNLGDQLAVLLIAIFTSILLISPYAMRHMKRAATDEDYYEDRLQTEDFVDEFAKLARTEWGTEILTDDKQDSKNVVEVLLKDVFQSAALQHAAQEFVVQILQSDRFREAVRRLVQELWSDLVSDPETVAQVVKVLEVAIQNPDIKRAVQELVLQVFVHEPEVREAIIGMIQQLGQDDQVREAVVQLLTDSAHTTLNDPGVLEHSMEFATDVVGDDIVQQTAGEALRKSVGHAVRPATTVLLAAAGVGFLILGVVAIGYSRSSEQEAVLFESAARSLHSNATVGMVRILTWPLRALQRVAERATAALWAMLPDRVGLVNYRDQALHRMRLVVESTVCYLAMQSVSLPWRALKATGRWLSAITGTVLGIIGERMQFAKREFSRAMMTLLAGFWTATVHWWQNLWLVSQNTWDALWMDALSWSQRAGEAFVNGWNCTGEYYALAFARMFQALQSVWNRMTKWKDELHL